MSLTRKVRFTGSRLKLGGLPLDRLSSTLEPWLNQVRDVLLGGAVIVPTGTRSLDPEDGELLLEDRILYLALDGEYHVLWPVEAGAAAASAAAVEGALRELFLYREHDVLFAYASCAVNATTTVVAAVPGKRIVLKRIKVNNPDTASGKTFYFDNNLHKGYLDMNGGTHIESFIGAPCVGNVGAALTCTVSNDGTSALYVTVGYLVLGSEELP